MDWFQVSRLERLTFKLQHIEERRAPSFGKRREACARLEPGRPVKAIKKSGRPLENPATEPNDYFFADFVLFLAVAQ